MNPWLLIIPVTSAFIGWLTIQLLIKLLFHPQKPVRLLGFKFQGVIPGRRDKDTQQLAKQISTEFYASANLEKRITDPAHLQKLMPLIDSHIDEFLRVKLKTEIPMIGMFIGDKTIDMLKKVFLQEITTLFPEIMGKFATDLHSELDLEGMIITRIQSIDPSQLEKTFHQQFGRELRYLGALAASIGFIIGVLEMIVLRLTG